MKITLPPAELVWDMLGDTKLIIADASDLVILQGAITEKYCDRYIPTWWTQTESDADMVLCQGISEDEYLPYKRHNAVRPAISPKEAKKLLKSQLPLYQEDGNTIVEYGEFPQTVVDEKKQTELNELLSRRIIVRTDRKFTFDANFNTLDDDIAPKWKNHYVFKYNLEQYIHIIGEPDRHFQETRNGLTIEGGKNYWVRVEPIKWIILNNGWWLAKDALFSGIRFNNLDEYDGKFSSTEMAKYLENYFSNQIIYKDSQNMLFDKIETTVQKITAKPAKHPSGIMVAVAPMTVSEQIQSYIQCGASFMLHGPSGIGKTARVEEIDPDLTAVPLWNGVLPEDIVGKVCFPGGNVKPLMTPNTSGESAIENQTQGGVWVAPDWYTELCRKCDAEPDKKHVLFIDEVTNAKPTTQSLIFHTVLKRSISPSKGKLPQNAVVVLAGNEKSDSNAAYNMPAPLFRRMSGHVRLEYNLHEWMMWASKQSRKHPNDAGRMNIHPFVVHFLLSNPGAFYSDYDEEDPPQFAIDPRGWEQVSDMIYDNNNVLHRELLLNKIGERHTNAMLEFAKNPLITLDDVLARNYSESDIPTQPDRRLALTMGLQIVDERNVQDVRKFINKYLGAEHLAIFDNVWVGKSAERALLIKNGKQR